MTLIGIGATRVSSDLSVTIVSLDSSANFFYFILTFFLSFDVFFLRATKNRKHIRIKKRKINYTKHRFHFIPLHQTSLLHPTYNHLFLPILEAWTQPFDSTFLLFFAEIFPIWNNHSTPTSMLYFFTSLKFIFPRFLWYHPLFVYGGW